MVTTRTSLSRELILDETASILMASGVANFRLKDLAEQLQVTIPNIYRYFNSREDLIASTFLNAYQKRANEELARMRIPENPWKDAAEFFGFIREVVKDEYEDKEWLRMLRIQALSATSFDDETSGQMRQIGRQLQDALTSLFRAAQHQGVVSEAIKAESLSFIVLSTRIGFSLVDALEGQPVDDEEIWGVYQAAFELLAKS
ncbi:MAG: TetR/AcrR family transcriptional regulator [Acidimicrobiaceae bacterium]